MSEFEVILGIDWLTKNGAILDCKELTKPKELSFKVQCELTSDAFLTTHLTIIESVRIENTLADILVVQDFEDVFCHISGLPPEERSRLLYRVGTR